jgi:hypothetical protein
MNEGGIFLPIQCLRYLKGPLTCCKILRHGASRFTSRPKEGVRQILIALKNPSHRPVLIEPAAFGFNGKHDYYYTTEATLAMLVFAFNWRVKYLCPPTHSGHCWVHCAPSRNVTRFREMEGRTEMVTPTE